MTTKELQKKNGNKVLNKHTPTLSFPNFTDNWEEKKLGDVGNIIGGGTPKTEIKEYWNGNINWFTPSEIKNKFISNSKRKITELGLKKSSAKLLPVGTLLFTSRATIGEVSISLNESTTNQGFQSVVVNDKNIKEFIYFWIIKNKKEFLKKSHGSTFLEISSKEIKKIKIKIPQKPEQEKIASFLGGVDDWLGNLKKQKEELEKYKKGIMQQIFPTKEQKTPALRFSDFTDKWEEKKLGEVFDNVGGTSLEKYVDDDGVYKFISIGNYSKDGKYIDNSQRIILNEKTKTKLLEKGNLVMVLNDKTLKGDIIGSSILIDKDDTYIYNQRSERLICKDNITPFFAWHYLNSRYFRRDVFSIAQGGTQIYVNFPSVKKIKIKFPKLPEQEKIASFLTSIDDIIESTEQKITALEKWKKGLMQKMFV